METIESEYNKYYFATYKPLIEKTCDGIKWLIERGVDKKFGRAIPNFQIQLNVSEYTGIKGFVLSFIDSDNKSVFGGDVDVVLHNNDQDWQVMEGKVNYADIDHTIKSVRTSSNPRHKSDEFEVSQVLVSAFLLLADGEFHGILKMTSSDIAKSGMELKKLKNS